MHIALKAPRCIAKEGTEHLAYSISWAGRSIAPRGLAKLHREKFQQQDSVRKPVICRLHPSSFMLNAKLVDMCHTPVSH